MQKSFFVPPLLLSMILAVGLVSVTILPATGDETGPAPVLAPRPAEPAWRPFFDGIDLAAARSDSPRLQRVYAARVDLEKEGVGFFASPKTNENYATDKKETVREQTNVFLRSHGLQLAVNANFFNIPKEEKYSRPGESNLRGLAVCDGETVSPPQEGHTAFCVMKDGTPKLLKYLEQESLLPEIRTAVAGQPILLRDGEIVPSSNRAVHPRTLVGFSRDGRYVYLVVIDGRRKDHSIGADFGDSARWLLYFGAWEGLNLDGGGSTTLVVQAKGDNPRALNKPSDNNFRYNGNSLGVRARPLPRKR